jgi:hypothetical protein
MHIEIDVALCYNGDFNTASIESEWCCVDFELWRRPRKCSANDVFREAPKTGVRDNNPASPWMARTVAFV